MNNIDDWAKLGRTSPLWAVCWRPGGETWDEEEFLETGRARVDADVARLTSLGARVGGRALDFGCGAGRLTQALARHSEHVVGLDVSAPMIDEARRLNEAPNVSWVLSASERLPFKTASFDLVYSDLVLQHLPRNLSLGYLREFSRVLRTGGSMVLGVPSRERWTLKGLAFRFAPRLVAWGQRLMGYPAPMPMHCLSERAVRRALPGCDVLSTDESDAHHWRHVRYFVVRGDTEALRNIGLEQLRRAA